MPLLQVRDFPQDIYETLAFEAKRERRTIAQQAVVLIQKGLDADPSPRERRRKLLEEIRSRTLNIPESMRNVDSAAMIREMREERTNRILATAGIKL